MNSISLYDMRKNIENYSFFRGKLSRKEKKGRKRLISLS